MPSDWPRNELANAKAVGGRWSGSLFNADMTTLATRFGILPKDAAALDAEEATLEAHDAAALDDAA